MEKTKWTITCGYQINKESGIMEKCGQNVASTMFFQYAKKGDKLCLLDRDYVCEVYIYALQVEDKYIYTYDYQLEENWTTYQRCDTLTMTGEPYVFEEDCYYRVSIQSVKKLSLEKICLEDILKRDWADSFGRNAQQFPKSTVDKESIKTQLDSLFSHERENIEKKVIEKTSDLKFFLMTDSHYTVNGTWDQTVENMKAVQETICADGVVHLGDMTDGLVPGEVTSQYVQACMADLEQLNTPIYYTMGNHDSNYFKKNPEMLTREEQQKLYLPKESNLYYYKDIEEQKIRMIFLESFLHTREIRYGFDAKQLDWLEKRLEELPNAWCTIVFSHVPALPRLHYWSKEILGSARLIQILKKYQRQSKGNLLAFIHGHNHADYIDTKEGFPIVSIGCAKVEYFEDKKPEGAVTYYRELGTCSQELWDVMTVSVRDKTIDFYRFGAGEDRHLDCREIYKQMSEQKKTKVITYGTFDLFHDGHYNLLKRAKALGDYLIVGVTTEHYDEQRGKLNIMDSLVDRIENVRKTGLADEIIVEDHEGQKIDDIQRYGVDIFTLGSDWVGTFDYLKEYCQVVYLDRTPDISSTMLRSNRFPIIRLGIVGTGRIAPRFLVEAKYVSGINVSCVYNPNKESADAFADAHKLDAYSGSFEGFLDAVDAIYIATPHETHYGYAKQALDKGKHVLCEKPLAFSKEEARDLFQRAREHSCILMEGIKTAYCPGFSQMVNLIKSGKIGEVRDVEACFSRLTAPNLREMVDVEYGGSFLEFGSYTVLPIIKLLGYDYKDVQINTIRGENGLDMYTKIQFIYDNGLATSKTGIGVKSEGQLLISGTKGYIIAESPWWLTRKFQVRFEDPNKVENYAPRFLGDGLRYEISDFILQIYGREGRGFRLTEADSVAMADVVERFMAKRKAEREALIEQNRNSNVNIWAHRGCSFRYPENTLLAFKNACEIKGLKGIELDIQLSADGEMVVFHDEKLDRLMDKEGALCNYTLAELKACKFKDWDYSTNSDIPVNIPTIQEVLELVKPYSESEGLLINIELKNSKVAYEGMEEKILELVKALGMEEYIIYSSFNPQSIRKLKTLDVSVQTGILQSNIQDCIKLAEEIGADAYHPNVDSMSTAGEIKTSMPIRAYNGKEPFYKKQKNCMLFDLGKMEEYGVTDFITNIPERYI